MNFQPTRLCSLWLLLLVALVSGCNEGLDEEVAAEPDPVAPTTPTTSEPDGATPSKPTTSPADPITAPVNITGYWRRLDAIYKLRQSGSSVQGVYYELYDSTIHGVIAGSVSGNRLNINVVVTYDGRPADGFTAFKSAVIDAKDHMTMTVVRSPKYQGQVQSWTRIQ